jgi:hypothetical protein
MAQGVAEAERERELSKRALTARIAGVRAELDWRERLRRDGLRYAVIGAAVVVATASLVVLRSRRRRPAAPEPVVASLDDVARQLSEIRAELARRRRDQGPLWQRLALRATTAAATGAGGAVARRMVERFGGDGLEAVEHAEPIPAAEGSLGVGAR